MASRFGPPTTDIADAAQVIARLGPLVVVKDGERGAIAVGGAVGGAGPDVSTGPGPDVVLRHPGFATAAIDTTGAGDSFDAAFIAAWLQRLPVAACLEIACRAGALSTGSIGGTAGQGSAAQIGLPGPASAPPST
jgi:sugar/nucleoside kinase (ribokinase family)